jgi:hypothetical protein
MSDTRMVLDVWSEFKLVVESLEGDVHKNATKGNLSAGVRVRKTVRKLRALGAELIKATLEAREEVKAATKAATKAAPAKETVVKPTVSAEKTAKKKSKAKG